MLKSFRMRICSCSEKTSVAFALASLPHLQTAIGKRLSAIQITKKRYSDTCPFSDVRSWDWPSSIQKLRKLSQNGINLLILSDNFLYWNTPAEAINCELALFEKELSVLDIAVIGVDSYFRKKKLEMPKLFKSVDDWYRPTVEEVIGEMVKGYKSETLCYPFGVLPYCLLDPGKHFRSQIISKNVPAFVGFQPWQYGRILKRWPASEFLFINQISAINGKPIEETGAIPMKIGF